MTKAVWTEKRLQRLFAYYNQRFWRGNLPTVHIRIRKLAGALGQIEWQQREIRIDIDAHPNDREIRSTLLHEMAHLATARKTGHGSEFWSQIEHLLRQQAPITIGFPETSGLLILQDAVPARFPLARSALNRDERKRQLRWYRRMREHGQVPQNVSDDDIISRFYDLAYVENLTWRPALFTIGREVGLIDVDHKPNSRWASELVAKGRKAHIRGRRHRSFQEKQRLKYFGNVE